jgi:hypothetical protein
VSAPVSICLLGLALVMLQASAFAGMLTGTILNAGVTAEVVDVQQILPNPITLSLARLNVLKEPPDGSTRVFVNDLNGPLYIIDGATLHTYLDMRTLRPNLKISPGLATGFVSFAFHPAYSSNGIFYTVHTEYVGATPATHGPAIATTIVHHSILTEWTATDPAANSFAGGSRELIRIESPHRFHNMGEIAFDPNVAPGHPDYGLLYIGSGDFGTVTKGEPAQLQRLDTLYGAVLRIDPLAGSTTPYDYAIPGDNPYANDGDPDTFGEIYAHGFRNGHRIAWDTGGTGTPIVSDIGQGNVEEVDILAAGANYGWPEREGTFALDAVTDPETVFALPGNDASLGFTYPAARYDHEEGLAIAGGFVYRADAMSPLFGKFVFGDIAKGRIFYADVSELLAADDGDPATTAAVYELNLLSGGASTTLLDIVREELADPGLLRVDLRIGMTLDGTLYLTTKQDGFVRKLVPTSPLPPSVPALSFWALAALALSLLVTYVGRLRVARR